MRGIPTTGRRRMQMLHYLANNDGCSVLKLNRNDIPMLFWTPERRSSTSCRYSCFFSYRAIVKSVAARYDFRVQNRLHQKCVWGRGSELIEWWPTDPLLCLCAVDCRLGLCWTGLLCWTVFSFLVIFYFYFGSCGRLSWLNCQLSSARKYSIFTYLFTYFKRWP